MPILLSGVQARPNEGGMPAAASQECPPAPWSPGLLFPKEDEGRWAGRTQGALPEGAAAAWTERVTPRTLQRECPEQPHMSTRPGQGREDSHYWQRDPGQRTASL